MTEPARPYSTLRDGKIVWVYPGEALPVAKVRWRLWIWFKQPGSKDLDADLKELGLPARQMVDEVD